MKQKSPLYYGVIGATIGGVAVWLLTTSVVNGNQYGMMQMMGYRTQNSFTQTKFTMNSSIDRHFIEQMIPHHEDAITMAKLAQTRATKPEIKELANNIISSQGKEIQEMKDWYRKWFGQEVPEDDDVMDVHDMMGGSGMHMGMMGNDADEKDLENAANFDKAFMQEMIPHHQMAVMMAQMLKRSTNRPEMKKLSENIISAQTKEIDEMRVWYKSWGFSE